MEAPDDDVTSGAGGKCSPEDGWSLERLSSNGNDIASTSDMFESYGPVRAISSAVSTNKAVVENNRKPCCPVECRALLAMPGPDQERRDG